MHKIIVAGSGTGVGKTIVSAILVTLTNGDYWKFVQCGEEGGTDVAVMETLIDTTRHDIYPPAYSLKAPLSPHHAARLEDVSINVNSIDPPKTMRPLIIESAGGIFVPLTTEVLSIDVFRPWDCKWVVVSRHYLGSINHTLLTLEALQKRNILIAGFVFNGEPNPDSESVILTRSQVPFLGRLLPEVNINRQTILKYAQLWQSHLSQLIP